MWKEIEDKKIEWGEDKNKLLIKTRNISFEDVQEAIENNNILDVSPHPNQEKYSNQHMIRVNINNYAYSVPCIFHKDSIFLKSAWPSRVENKKYNKQK